MPTETEGRVAEFPVHYGTAKIDHLDVAFRDTGPKEPPVTSFFVNFPLFEYVSQFDSAFCRNPSD